MLLAHYGVVVDVGPASQGLGDESDESEEAVSVSIPCYQNKVETSEDLQGEEGESFSSMLDRDLDTEGGVEVDVAVVVALGSEDECGQPPTTVSTTHANKGRQGHTNRRRSYQW